LFVPLQSKPLTIKQHALDSVLNPQSRSTSPAPPAQTYAQEQEALRSETIAVFQTAVDGDSDTDDLLVPREKTKDDIEQEEEEYRHFLQGEVGKDLGGLITIDEGIERIHEEGEGETRVRKNSKKTKRSKGGKEKEQSDHEFLMK
jgi:protein KRI1